MTAVLQIGFFYGSKNILIDFNTEREKYKYVLCASFTNFSEFAKGIKWCLSRNKLSPPSMAGWRHSNMWLGFPIS